MPPTAADAPRAPARHDRAARVDCRRSPRARGRSRRGPEAPPAGRRQRVPPRSRRRGAACRRITARERRAARVKQDQGVLHETGIRTLRRKPVFTTPNVFPPHGFARTRPATTSRSRGQSAELRALLRLQGEVLDHPPLLRPAVPAVRGVQLRQAHRAGRSARPRRAADRRPREDRLPGRPQAAALRARS